MIAPKVSRTSQKVEMVTKHVFSIDTVITGLTLFVYVMSEKLGDNSRTPITTLTVSTLYEHSVALKITRNLRLRSE